MLKEQVSFTPGAKHEVKLLPLKCTDKKWCGAMVQSLDGGLNHGKGLSTVSSIVLATGKHGHTYVAYKRSLKDRGLLLRYCPWCAGELLPKSMRYTKTKKCDA